MDTRLIADKSHQDAMPGRSAPRGHEGVTPRALALAAVLLVTLLFGAFYVELAWFKIHDFSAGVPAMAPLVVLFLLVALAGTPLLRRLALTRREALSIYAILIVGAPLVSHGILFWVLPKVVAYYYVAHREPAWQTTFLRLIPTWFAPTEPEAIEGFFQGHASVPWSLWWTPLLAWGSFLVALFICTLCAMAIIQRQWISHERLSFPIAQIPLELVQETRTGNRSRACLPKERVFWMGLALAFLVNFMSSLSAHIPSVPSLPLGPLPLISWQRVGPLAGLGEIDLVLWPWMIAVAYLIPKELSFSAWFFWIVRVGLTVVAISAGHTPQRPEDWYESGFPAPHYQAGGAALALFIWVAWVARKHLSHVLRTTFSRGSDGGDRGEPMSYRLAVIGMFLTYAFMVYWCWLAGCRVLFALVLVGLIVGYYIMWARLRAETGLGFIPFPLEIQDGLASILGSSNLTPREIVTMVSARCTFFPGFGQSAEVLTGNALESFKIADASGLNARRLTRALIAGFLVALLLGIALVLIGCYHYGYFGLAMGGAYGWPSNQVQIDGGRIFDYLTNPRPVDINGLIGIGAGSAIAILLGFMRLRFWWWPFHPVGYIAANCFGMQWYYMPFFLGWACKSLAIRYGGLRLYRATVPFAIGLVVGDLLNQGFWSMVAVFTQGAA